MTTVLAWTAAVAAVAGVERATAGLAPPLRMAVIIVVLFTAMKVVVALTWMGQGGRLSPARWAAFAAWPGMRPSDFAVRRDPPRRLDAWPGWRALGGGVLLLLLARLAVERSRPAALALALPALSLVLHFGIFRLAAAFWRSRGFEVAPPFDAPLLSRSLGEFWSRRWNRAFSDMTALLVYRPAARAFGPGAGLLASFLFSGLLHELAISVPVGAGFGGPLAYFLLHGLLVTAERRRPTASRRAWAVAGVLLPLPVLFHPPFLEGVVLPMLR